MRRCARNSDAEPLRYAELYQGASNALSIINARQRLCAPVHSPRAPCPSICASTANTNSRLTTIASRAAIMSRAAGRLRPHRVRLKGADEVQTTQAPTVRRPKSLEPYGGFGVLGQFMGIRSRWGDQQRSGRSLECSHVRSRQHLRRLYAVESWDTSETIATTLWARGCPIHASPILGRNNRVRRALDRRSLPRRHESSSP